MGGGGSLIHRITNRRIKQGKLVKIRKKAPKAPKPNWVDLTYKSKEITPHIKNEQRGKKVVTKTTYHSVKNPDNLSKRKLKKQFEAGNTPLHPGSGEAQTFVTQKKKTKYHDSRRWHDDVQDRKKKQVEYTTGNTLADQHADRAREDKTTYRSKTKYLRANKEGKEIVKKQMADAGIEGVKNLRIRGKVQRESSWNEECYDYGAGCMAKFAGSTGNKELKTTKVFKYKKGTQASEAFEKPEEGNPKMLSEIIPGTVKKIRRKDYGDVSDRSSRSGAMTQAPQFKADKGKVSKLKVKTYEGKTHKFRQNVFSKGTVNDSEIALEEGDVQWITKKDFKDAKKFDRQTNRGTEWKRYKKTGIPDREQKRIYLARK